MYACRLYVYWHKRIIISRNNNTSINVCMYVNSSKIYEHCQTSDLNNLSFINRRQQQQQRERQRKRGKEIERDNKINNFFFNNSTQRILWTFQVKYLNN